MPKKSKGKKKGNVKKKKTLKKKKKKAVKEEVETEDETENEEEEEERLAVRIEELKSQVSALQNYNIKLRNQKKKNLKKAVEFSKYFDREIQARNDESKELETLVNVQREVTKEGRQKIETYFTEKIEALEKTFNRSHSMKTSDLISLGAQLKSLAMQDAKRERFEHDKKIAMLRKRIEKRQSQCTEKRNFLERDLLARAGKHRKEIEDSLREKRQKALSVARKRWNRRGRELQDENVHLATKQRKQDDTIKRLRIEKQRLQEKSRSLELELSLGKDRHKQIEKMEKKQKHSVKKETKLLANAEASLRDEVKRCNESKKSSERRRRQEMRNKKLNLTATSELLQIKMNELAKIQSFAKQVVRGRDEIEKFFFDALTHAESCKREEKKRNLETKRQDVRRASLQLLHDDMNSRPEQHIFSTMIDEEEEKQQTHRAIIELEKSIERGLKIDVQKLSWNLRVEFLKLLFARINSIHPSSRHEETRRDEILNFLHRGGRDGDDEEEEEDTTTTATTTTGTTQKTSGRAALPTLA